LVGRQQRVVLGGVSSISMGTHGGVLQGSVLGPLLFLMFINDLTLEVASDLFLFADDSTLLNIFENCDQSIAKLNDDLLSVENRAKKWLIDFNPLKTEVMTFSCNQIPSHANNLRFFDRIIKEVTIHKHLGISIHNRLRWDEHIDYITTKCMKRLNILRRYKKHVSRAILSTIYFTMIRAVIEYGICVFYNNNSMLAAKLERIQYRACLIVCGALNLTSYDRMLLDLGWPKIKDRIDFLRVSLFYKAINGLPHSMLTYINDP
jgi:hypothetical protein